MTIRYRTFLGAKALSALVAGAMASTAMAADLPIQPKARSHAQTDSGKIAPTGKSAAASKSRAAGDANDVTGSIAWPESARAGLTPAVAAISYAYSARSSFAKARAAMESAILLHEDVVKSNFATLETATADVLSELKALEAVPRVQPSDAVKQAMAAVQDWHDTGLKIIKPPAEGLTALPFPATVAARANAVSVKLDQLIEQANALAPANPSRQRLGAGSSHSAVVPANRIPASNRQ